MFSTNVLFNEACEQMHEAVRLATTTRIEHATIYGFVMLRYNLVAAKKYMNTSKQ